MIDKKFIDKAILDSIAIDYVVDRETLSATNTLIIEKLEDLWYRVNTIALEKLGQRLYDLKIEYELWDMSDSLMNLNCWYFIKRFLFANWIRWN